MKISKPVLIVIILLALGLWAWASASYHDLQRENRVAIAARQAAVLEAAAWKRVATQPAEEILTPSLREEVEAADEAGTDIAFVVSSNSEESVVSIPLPPRPSPVAPLVAEEVPQSDGSESTTPLDLLSSIDLTIKPRLEMRVDLDATGNMFYTGKILVHLNAPDLNFHSYTEHPLQGASIGLGKKIRDALKYSHDRPPRFTLRLRPLRHVRFGWSAGAGLLVAPTGQPVLGVAVLYGVQF